MAYITREDGERFVIPAYRDILRAKKPSLLKREITLLASNYGEYATIQKKAREEYEVAFSPDTGYLLGETVWAYFNRPRDLIYCEAIPNTSEAILVIVKSGSVYLDGSFPIDSIQDELIIFKTQQNFFDIYIVGEVPISQTPEEDKISFDANSVHSFTILDKPVFPLLPTLKAFQLQLVEVVLRDQGVGALPLRKWLMWFFLVIFIWIAWSLLSRHEVELPTSIIRVVNPYQAYITSLSTPSPDQEIRYISDKIGKLLAIPGWSPNSVTYDGETLQSSVQSSGARTGTLLTWAKYNNAQVEIQTTGIFIDITSTLPNRPAPVSINSVTEVIATLIDRLSFVIPGNPLKIGVAQNHGQYIEMPVTIEFSGISLTTLNLIGQQLQGLPLVMMSATIQVTNGYVSGSLVFTALGK